MKQQRNEPKSFKVENAILINRNFSGRMTPYNRAGSRNFCIVLDPVIAQALADDGWLVKFPKPEDADERDPFIAVQLGYNEKTSPPKITMITSTARTKLTEANVEVLDWADIETADLICNAYYWDVNGKTGIKAYLKSMWVTIEEDELDRKYAIHETEQ